MVRKTLFICAALAASVGLMAADKLNIKTGLWEITSSTQMSGVPPLPKELLDKMTPEQRASLQAQMKARSDKPSTDTNRECITQKDIENPFSGANKEDCKHTIVTSSRTTQEVRLTCSGKIKGAGLMKVNTPTPESMNGTMDLQVGEGSDVMVMKVQLKGRWLGIDCGEEANGEDSDENDESDESEAE